MSGEVERRVFALDSIKVERREAGEGEDAAPVIRGHAAVFNKLSENLGGFREQIDPKAFNDVLGDDVRALFNHDSNIVLGRQKAGTLRLKVDKEGLRYEIDPPDTQAARDLLVSIERGDVDQSSFGFVVDEDKWDEDDEGRVTRTILKVKRLLDVSPVTYPAYPDASVGLRSMDKWREEIREQRTDNLDTLEAELRIREVF